MTRLSVPFPCPCATQIEADDSDNTNGMDKVAAEHKEGTLAVDTVHS